jgi:dienelactone hydrolase
VTQDADLDPVAWTLQRHDEAPLRLTFRATTEPDALRWQDDLRAKLADLLGGFPQPRQRTALSPSRTAIQDSATYVRETVVFNSRPGVAVLVHVLTPKQGAAPFATVVCIPGHGRGADEIAGIGAMPEEDGSQPFALEAVRHGLAAVAIEPMGFGRRRDPMTRERGAGHTACEPVAGSALLLGETLTGWRVWDVMRTVDYIRTRPDLDAHRIGCVGFSGGGTCALFAAALDQRIACAYVSGCLGTFRESIMRQAHCIDNYVPGVLGWAELYDIAGLIAPRPLFCESGESDPLFPAAAARECFGKVEHVYTVMGAQGRAQLQSFDGGHRFHGGRGWPFVASALAGVQIRSPH